MIAVAHSGIYSGGAHQAFYQLAGFQRAGLEVISVWGADPHTPDTLERIRNLDIPVEILPLHQKPTRASVTAFHRLLKRYQPDVVECFKSGAQYHALLAGIGLRRHALVFYRGISSRMDVFQGMKYRLSRVDRVIANCSDLKEIMVRQGHISAEKIDVIFGEIDPACLDPDKVNSDGLKAELGIPDGVPVILNLANYSPWKGREIILKAAAELNRQGLAFQLLFAGVDSERHLNEVQSLGLSGRVTLSPFRPDPERLLKISDIYVNASTANESLNATMLNAQAMALPIVATRLAGQEDIVQNGVTGYLVEPGDITALTAALANLIRMKTDQRREMGRLARIHALENFSPEARTKKRIECYTCALEHRRRVLINSRD